MNLSFWLLLNVGVPIAGPICTLALVAPAYGSRVAAALICGSVKDGQMFWCAIALCAASAYEAASALQRGSPDVAFLIGLTTAACFVGFACSALVMLGSVNAHNRRVASARCTGFARAEPQGFSRAEIGLSMSLTIIAATLSVILHVFVS